MLRAMETHEVLRHRVQREEPLKARLRLATTRLAEAEQERCGRDGGRQPMSSHGGRRRVLQADT